MPTRGQNIMVSGLRNGGTVGTIFHYILDWKCSR